MNIKIVKNCKKLSKLSKLSKDFKIVEQKVSGLRDWMAEWLSQWQGHLLSCSGQIKSTSFFTLSDYWTTSWRFFLRATNATNAYQCFLFKTTETLMEQENQKVAI